MGEEAEADIPSGRSSGPARSAAPDASFDAEQYQLLLACCQAGDMDRWNRWRRANVAREVLLAGADLAGRTLDGADLSGVDLVNADLSRARLGGADLSEANLAGASLAAARLDSAVLWMARLDGARLVRGRLDGANLRGARLAGADLASARLRGADLSGAGLSGAKLTGAWLAGADLCRCDLSGADVSGADLRGVDGSFAVVDGATLLAGCTVDRRTDFAGAGLAVARVSPGLRQLLGYVVRRNQWARYCRRGPWPVRAIKTALCRPFWWLSDYGLSTWRIAGSFCAAALALTAVLGAYPQWVTVDGAAPGGVGFLHALYVTVATMTSLGLGGAGVHPAGGAGAALMTSEVLLGYVFLAVLVARFVVMFTSPGPAETFAPDENALWRRALRGLLSDPRRSRVGPIRKLARRLCEPNRIGRRPVALLLHLARRFDARRRRRAWRE